MFGGIGIKTLTWISKLMPWFNTKNLLLQTETKRTAALNYSPNSQDRSTPWEVIELCQEYTVKRQGRSVEICLTRGERGNSLTLEMVRKLSNLYRTLAHDQNVHCIVLTGQGKYFCTGIDLQEDLILAPDQHFTMLADLYEAIDTSPQTTLVAINGPAFGGGVGLAFVCDIRIAIASANMCLSEVRLGLCPATISKYLVREWGPGLTRMAILTAATVPPERLYNIGALHAIESNAEALELSMTEWLHRLKYTAPKASSWGKTLVRELYHNGQDDETYQLRRRIFEAMLAEGSESSFGVAQFKMGLREIDWANREIFEQTL